MLDAEVALLEAELERTRLIAALRLGEARLLRTVGVGDGDGRPPAIASSIARAASARFVAVDDLTFDVRRGEVFGFLGSNGAGKSTTIRMLCGLLTPDRRRARRSTASTSGRDPEGVKRRIGYMSQQFSLYERLTVDENIRFYAGLYGLDGRATRAPAALCAGDGAASPGGARRWRRTLSGGWRQRLALGCALLHEPPILFLDEPTGRRRSGVAPRVLAADRRSLRGAARRSS